MIKERTIKDLEQEYSLDFEKIVGLIESDNVKRVLLQFPEGLKPYAVAIVDYLEGKVDVEFFIWLGDCFGACDTPQGIENMKIDLMIQIGHSALQPNYLQ